jgi:hypothetical protein
MTFRALMAIRSTERQEFFTAHQLALKRLRKTSCRDPVALDGRSEAIPLIGHQ